MSTIQHKFSITSEMILMVLYEVGEPLDKDNLQSFVILGSPLISGNYQEAYHTYSKAIFVLANERMSESNRLFDELKGLKFLGLIEIDGDLKEDSILVDNKDVKISLTSEGERIAEALVKNRKPIFRPRVSTLTTVFIACAFGKQEIDDLTMNSFFPACEKHDFKPVRIDMSEPHQTITERMMEEITGAACVIADLTYARPSVYFEVGYAVGLGIPVILTCNKTHFNGEKDDQRVHFDLEQYKISYWEQNESGEFQWTKNMNPQERLSSVRLSIEQTVL